MSTVSSFLCSWHKQPWGGAGLRWHFNLQLLALQPQCLAFDGFYFLCAKMVKGSKDFILAKSVSFIRGDVRHMQNSGPQVSKGESEALGIQPIKPCSTGSNVTFEN